MFKNPKRQMISIQMNSDFCYLEQSFISRNPSLWTEKRFSEEQSNLI